MTIDHDDSFMEFAQAKGKYNLFKIDGSTGYYFVGFSIGITHDSKGALLKRNCVNKGQMLFPLLLKNVYKSLAVI